MSLEHGWLKRAIERTKNDYKTWPQWMKDLHEKEVRENPNGCVYKEKDPQ